MDSQILNIKESIDRMINELIFAKNNIVCKLEKSKKEQMFNLEVNSESQKELLILINNYDLRISSFRTCIHIINKETQKE